MGQHTLPDTSTVALNAARQIQQQLQFNAELVGRRGNWWQAGIALLAIAAASLSVLSCVDTSDPSAETVRAFSRGGLVLVGLGLSILIVRSPHEKSRLIEQALSSGAAATERAIYLHRTLLQYTPQRSTWLNQQLTRIQKAVQEQLGADWVLQLPSTQETGEADDLSDLQVNEYLQQRLVPALEVATQRIAQLAQQRTTYQAASLLSAGLVVLLPILDPDWTVGGALAATMAIGSLFWQQVTRLGDRIDSDRQLTLGLNLLKNTWESQGSAASGDNVLLVWATEHLLEEPYRQTGDRLRESLLLLERGNPDLIGWLLNQAGELGQVQFALPATSKPEILDPLEAIAPASPEKAEAKAVAAKVEAIDAAKTAPATPVLDKLLPAVASTTTGAIAKPTAAATVKSEAHSAKRGRPHAFVVMPFGRKQGPDGRWIDFNAIYQDLIKPALEDAGFESFRADEESSSGDIISDMFQELLLADLVVADLSIDNANVFYELGIRHALRRRGVVHIQAGRAYMPFDIFNVRTLPYKCDENGCPDLHFVEKDRHNLSKMIQATWNSERNRVHSPIFNLLTGLPEPDRKALRTPLATGYWEEYTNLQSKIAIAQRQKRIGDVVLLAEEVNNPLIKEDIVAEAASALASIGNSALALKQYQQGLKINPENTFFRCQEAFHLNRLGQADEAIVKLEKLLKDVPNYVDAFNKLARIYKDLWRNNWKDIEDEELRIQAAYESSFLLQKSIENYLRGYRVDQNHYYSGINALMLSAVLEHLATTVKEESGDPQEIAYRQMIPAMRGAVQFCLESSLNHDPNDYWAALSLGDLSVCVATSPKQVATSYRKALAVLWNNSTAVEATLGQLRLLERLKFRPEHVQAGIKVLEADLVRSRQMEGKFDTVREEETKPSKVLLFTGHMIDRPDRKPPRFPAEMESEVQERLEELLEKLDAHEGCLAILPGLACGGDILFAEACLKRDISIEVYLPFEPGKFIQESVNFAGDTWVKRFYDIYNNPNVTRHLQPTRLGEVPEGDSPFIRNNRWALYSTLVNDISRIRLIALWNGQTGDGPGGTADMVNQVRQLGGIVEHLDITKFDYWKKPGIKKLDQIFTKLEIPQ
jgi:tetratricopeptide (TPR) repeat protein